MNQILLLYQNTLNIQGQLYTHIINNYYLILKSFNFIVQTVNIIMDLTTNYKELLHYPHHNVNGNLLDMINILQRPVSHVLKL